MNKFTHLTGQVEGGNQRSLTRLVLRKAWNGQHASAKNEIKPAGTPFRLVNNAGDYLGRLNYSKTLFQPSNCNPKYVYDGSVYTRFKKEKAVNTNYHDTSL